MVVTLAGSVGTLVACGDDDDDTGATKGAGGSAGTGGSAGAGGGGAGGGGADGGGASGSSGSAGAGGLGGAGFDCSAEYGSRCGASCVGDASCGSGLFCSNGACTAQCKGEVGCLEGQFCSVQGRCVNGMGGAAGGSLMPNEGARAL